MSELAQCMLLLLPHIAAGTAAVCGSGTEADVTMHMWTWLLHAVQQLRQSRCRMFDLQKVSGSCNLKL